ncbi:MAG: flagellar basal body P-ring formation protein FlgA [Spirochaetales bacterium]|nr:flagellar basal body P-ring formation protein FlgA [Spirochaetales bacterium]
MTLGQLGRLRLLALTTLWVAGGLLSVTAPLDALTWRIKEHPDLQTWPQPSALFQAQDSSSTQVPSSWQSLPAYQYPSWVPLEKFLQDWTPPTNVNLVGEGFTFLPPSIPIQNRFFFENLMQFLREQKSEEQETPQGLELEILSYHLPDQAPNQALPEHPRFHLIQASWRKGCLMGRIQISYHSSDETVSRTEPGQTIELKVQSQIPIAVMLDARPQGNLIHSWDWTWQWRSVDHLPWRFLTPKAWRFAQGVKLRARRDLSPGDILIPGQNIKEEKPVNRGDVVMLKILHGAIEVDLPGTALESGTEGSQVKVLSTTGQEFHGVVDGKNLVRVSWP